MIPYIPLSDEARVSAAWDAYLCQNLMARFVHAQELAQEEAQFDQIWSRREDISYGDNDGFLTGRASVKRRWVEGRNAVRMADMALLHRICPQRTEVDDLGAGSMERHNLMSPLVEVARDGKTAKGMWYCPGVNTQTEADGRIHLDWHYVRYGVDFIQEDGQWRIWHLFVGTEFRFEPGLGYVPGAGTDPLPGKTEYPQNPLTAGMPLGREVLPEYDLPIHVYSIKYGWSPYPAVPVPYETFDETFTYGPEPFMGKA